MYGTTQIPVNTFNKVWILPDTAKVYEQKNTALVTTSHLKVMLDEDYLSLSKHTSLRGAEGDAAISQGNTPPTNTLASNIVRQIILPAIEQEVNTGKNFAQMRQIYNSMILAVWFKKNLKQAFLNQVYTNKSKTNGVNVDDRTINEKIYKQYLQAYKKGVFNYIKEEPVGGVSKGPISLVSLRGAEGDEAISNKTIARKYFSGGLAPETESNVVPATRSEEKSKLLQDAAQNSNTFVISGLTESANAAMTAAMKWTDVQGGIERWLPLAQQVSLEDINQDMFRDYDYRYVKDGVPLKPEIVFIQALVWAKMALKKAEAAGIKTRDVLIARDARKIEPEIADAEIAALRFAGLNVVFVGDEPNCVTSYSWAVQSHEWLMTIFDTASHVSEPDNIIVRGFKVTQLGVLGGNVLSLTTKEIKNQSLALVKEMLADKTSIKKMGAAEPGKLIRKSIEDEAIRFNIAVGLVASYNKSLYQLGRDIKQDIKDKKDPNVRVQSVVDSLGKKKPLLGLKVVVEGSHTPSGPLAVGVFENLGAEVVGLNQDVQEVSGLHNADPSIEKNLEALKKKIIETHANFGIAFDLDGDRGAILIPEWDEVGVNVKAFHMLAPDNILGMLMPHLLKDWGYTASGRKVGVIRDVLGTYGVNDAASKNGVKMFQTDAGYVYLKALKERMEAEGYLFPVYGERSGHTWLNVSGEIENPVAVAVLFSTIEAKFKDPSDINGVINLYRKLSIPYSQSPRFQPFYHPRLLQWLSGHNEIGWKYVPGVNPPQAIVALGKDETVKRLSRKFPAGSTFGEYKVTAFNTYQDPADEGGLYRFADVMFEKNGQFVGRVVVRASSNDPTFVMSYEAPILDGKVQEADKNRVMTSGLVMKFMADEGLGIFTRAQMRESMNYLPIDKQEIQFIKANLGPVEEDLKSYANAAMSAKIIPPSDVLPMDEEENPSLSGEQQLSDHDLFLISARDIIEDQLNRAKPREILQGVGKLIERPRIQDHAMKGGIDLNSRNLKMQSEGQKVDITFNPAMIAQFKRGDFSGVRIEIIDVVPINLMLVI